MQAASRPLPSQALHSFAYLDRSLALPDGTVMLAPSAHALSLEALHLSSAMRLLCIGSGVGYFATVASYLVGREGRCHGIELRSVTRP